MRLVDSRGLGRDAVPGEIGGSMGPDGNEHQRQDTPGSQPCITIGISYRNSGEAAMTYKSQDSISSLAERSSAVIIGETAGEEGQTTTEFLDDAPTAANGGAHWR